MEKLKIISTIIKVGGSNGVTIPKIVIQNLDLKLGDRVEIEIKKA